MVLAIAPMPLQSFWLIVSRETLPSGTRFEVSGAVSRCRQQTVLGEEQGVRKRADKGFRSVYPLAFLPVQVSLLRFQQPCICKYFTTRLAERVPEGD